MTLRRLCSRFRPLRTRLDRAAARDVPGRRLALLLAPAIALADAACTRPEASGESPPKNDAPAAERATRPATEPTWRTLAVFREHLAAGVAVAPVLEAVDDLRGEAKLVVAVVRAEREPALALELWSLKSGGPEAIFAPIGEGEALSRLQDGDPPALDGDARRRLLLFTSTPGTAVIRPRGLEGAPDELLGALARALGEARDPAAAPQARADALATVIRGLDDELLLGRDRVLEVIAAVDRGSAIAASEALGARRRRVTLGGAPPVTLTLLSLEGGWVVGDVGPPGELQGASGSTEPAAEPSPTAP